MASTLNEEEIADLRDQFDAIDVDKNGSISLEEMRQVNISIIPNIYEVAQSFFIFVLITMVSVQALAKDLPWKLKESRVLEILQAVSKLFLFFI